MSEVYVVGDGIVFLSYGEYVRYCKDNNLKNEYEKYQKKLKPSTHRA